MVEEKLPVGRPTGGSLVEGVGVHRLLRAGSVGGLAINVPVSFAVGLKHNGAAIGRPYRIAVLAFVESEPGRDSARDVVNPKVIVASGRKADHQSLAIRRK